MCIGDHAGGGVCGVILPGGLAAQGALRSLAAHALLSPGSHMAHTCARPPAELPDERLAELLEHAQRWVQWASTRHAALQAEAAAPAVQPP